MTSQRSGSGMEPPVAFGPRPHCIMGRVRSFPADAPPSPRLLRSRCCASGMGSWFPVGCGRHRIEPSIRKRGLLRKAARASGTSGEEAASVGQFGDALLQRKSLKKSLLSITNFKFISLSTKSVLQEEEKRSASNAHKGRYDSP